MDEGISAEQRAKEEAEIKARDAARRREEEERKRRAEEERKAEERKIKEEKLKRLEEERRRLKAEEEEKKLGSAVIPPLPPVPPSHIDDGEPGAMKAWYLDDETSKPTYRQASLRKGCKRDAPKVTLAQLREIGIIYFRINLNDFRLVNQIVRERCYKHTDEVRLSQTGKDESFLEKWFQEHFNEDEQIRLITDGSCYFDVRSKSDTWIRMQCNAGDLVVIAPGLCHRGTLDESDYCAIFRIFRDAQRWQPLFRADRKADTNPIRLQYLKASKKGSVAADLGFK